MTTTLDHLPTIDLAGLNDTAALLHRTDRKYLVRRDRDGAALDAFRTRLVSEWGAVILDIDGQQSFTYRSTYLDTVDNQSLRGAALGRRRRFKVRIRTYVATGDHHLEVKTRGSRGTTTKHRLPLPDPGDLDPGQVNDFVNDHLAAAHVDNVGLTDLVPALTTSYRRRTLVLPALGCRITLDSDLVWSDPTGHDVRVPGLLVVETKTPAGIHPVADRTLWAHGVRRSRFSKYGTGRVLLDPTLPHHRWHRALTRDLTDREHSIHHPFDPETP